MIIRIRNCLRNLELLFRFPYLAFFLQDPCTEADRAEQCLLRVLKKVHDKRKKLGTDQSEGKDVMMFEEVSKAHQIILSTHLISNIYFNILETLKLNYIVWQVHKEYPKDYKMSEKYKHW